MNLYTGSLRHRYHENHLVVLTDRHLCVIVVYLLPLRLIKRFTEDDVHIVEFGIPQRKQLDFTFPLTIVYLRNRILDIVSNRRLDISVNS